MKNVYKVMLLVAVMLISVTTNANKKSTYKIAPQLTTSQRMMKKAKPADFVHYPSRPTTIL